MTDAGLALLKTFEDCRLEAYLDTAGVPTIGWGTTRYPSGTKVALGDVCTQAQADGWLARDVEAAEDVVDATTAGLAPNQTDALISFTYNLGADAFRSSLLRQVVNVTPNDPSIRSHFMPWHFDGTTPVRGLWIRRHAEADHYFGVATLCPPMPEPTPPLAAA